MKRSDNPEAVMTGAYRIFVEETRRELRDTSASLLKSTPGKDEFDNATIKFHRIRGGAGFFGLSEIESTAAKLERLLKASEESVVAELGTVKELIQTLERCVQGLPEPEAEPSRK